MRVRMISARRVRSEMVLRGIVSSFMSDMGTIIES